MTSRAQYIADAIDKAAGQTDTESVAISTLAAAIEGLAMYGVEGQYADSDTTTLDVAKAAEVLMYGTNRTAIQQALHALLAAYA